METYGRIQRKTHYKDSQTLRRNSPIKLKLYTWNHKFDHILYPVHNLLTWSMISSNKPFGHFRFDFLSQIAFVTSRTTLKVLIYTIIELGWLCGFSSWSPNINIVLRFEFWTHKFVEIGLGSLFYSIQHKLSKSFFESTIMCPYIVMHIYRARVSNH